MTAPEKRWRTCIHEAGHACAALLLGRAGIGAAVFDEGGGLATSQPETATMPPAADFEPERLDPLYRGDDWPSLLLDATYTAAGAAAVDLLLHPERSETNVAGGDRAMLDSAARAAIGTNCDFFIEMYFNYMMAARARALLKPFLRRVERVAQELDRKSRLSSDEVARAMFPEAGTKTANVEEPEEEICGPG